MSELRFDGEKICVADRLGCSARRGRAARTSAKARAASSPTTVSIPTARVPHRRLYRRGA